MPTEKKAEPTLRKLHLRSSEVGSFSFKILISLKIIWIKFQILFSVNKKNVTYFSSADWAYRVLKVQIYMRRNVKWHSTMYSQAS